MDNSYYLGLIYIDEVEQVKESQGIFIEDISEIDKEFFTSTLGWNVNIWDFSDLDLDNGNLSYNQNLIVILKRPLFYFTQFIFKYLLISMSLCVINIENIVLIFIK
jgi:hypothetical protein